MPEELSKKKKEKTKSPPKKKSKGKKKVEEKRKHVRYAVEGEPHRTMPTGATRGQKYQAGAAYDNDVQVMQRTLESEYEVSLGRVCQHYKVCLAEETQARRELGLALLLVTDVRAYTVQMVLRCGTKNAQSTAAARELFEERYRSSSPRQVATGLISQGRERWGAEERCGNGKGAPGGSRSGGRGDGGEGRDSADLVNRADLSWCSPGSIFSNTRFPEGDEWPDPDEVRGRQTSQPLFFSRPVPLAQQAHSQPTPQWWHR